jgi:hypothetical protein
MERYEEEMMEKGRRINEYREQMARWSPRLLKRADKE